MISNLQVLLTALVTLFPVVNPIGDAPIFLALTQRYPQSAQRILARKIAAYGLHCLRVRSSSAASSFTFSGSVWLWYRLQEAWSLRLPDGVF